MGPLPFEKLFEPDDLYFQWLNRRRAWPMRFDYRLMPYFWIISGILSFVLAISIQIVPPIFVQAIVGVSTSIIVFILPLANTFLDFLYYVPRCVHDDDSSSMMQFMFMAPVESNAVVRDVRKWAMLVNLKHLAPSVLLFIVGFAAIFSDGGSPFQDLPDALSIVIPLIILFFLFWAFLLGTGLVAAGLPWRATSTGLVVLCWVVPILGLVFWGGTGVARATYELFFSETYPGDPFTDVLHYVYRPPEFPWFTWHYIVLLLAPTIIVHRMAPRLMERLRRGDY